MKCLLIDGVRCPYIFLTLRHIIVMGSGTVPDPITISLQIYYENLTAFLDPLEYFLQAQHTRTPYHHSGVSAGHRVPYSCEGDPHSS